MAILFRQFNIIENIPRETELGLAGITISGAIGLVEDLYHVEIEHEILRDGLLRPDVLLLVNGRAVSDSSMGVIILRDNDVLECLPYAVGG